MFCGPAGHVSADQQQSRCPRAGAAPGGARARRDPDPVSCLREREQFH